MWVPQSFVNVWVPNDRFRPLFSHLGPMANRPSSCRRWFALLLLVALTSCSSPPEDEQSRARAAIEEAREAGAEEYAAQDLARATDKFALAETELASQRSKKMGFLRRFGKSEELFGQSYQLAEVARTAAGEERIRVQEELAATVRELRRRISASQTIVDGEAWALFRDRAANPSGMMDLEDELSGLEEATREVEKANADGDTERALRVGRAALSQLSNLEALIEETSRTGKVNSHLEK